MEKNKSDIKVSVFCLVYNHEKYLRQCLDGFVNQKTNFDFEVLIHDDASTDSSQAIIREYEEKYPDIIKPIYQQENQYSKGVKIMRTHLFPKAQGKYLAFCEGDDYWCNENKLQLQYDALENNGQCKMCVHKVDFINKDGNKIDGFYPEDTFKAGLHNSMDFLSYMPKYYFHTSSYFFKKDAFKEYYINNLASNISPVGDVAMMYSMFIAGNIYYIDEVMSHYRRFSDGSWSVGQKKRTARNENKVRLCDYLDAFCDQLAIRDISKYDSCIERIRNESKRLRFWFYVGSEDYKKICSKEFKDIFNTEVDKSHRILYKFLCHSRLIRKIYISILDKRRK